MLSKSGFIEPEAYNLSLVLLQWRRLELYLEEKDK